MYNYKLIVEKIDQVIRVINIMVSVLVIGAIVVDYGFVLNPAETLLIQKVYTVGWWTYIVSFSFQLVCHWSRIRKKALSLTTIMGVMLYISVLPRIFEAAEGSVWDMYIYPILENKYYVGLLLGIFSVIELSKGVTKFVNKRTNPAFLAVLCFAITIIFGALLLMLPRSTMEHIQLPMIDALFISTSAVCVTGLSTVEVAHTFTLEGQLVIALLIQAGGLGIMTITTFFALFFMDGVGLYSQFALKDMLSSGVESLISILLYVLGFTIVIELIGALFIWLSIHPLEGMTLDQEIFFSIFHAVSAFCNAGFSTLEGGLGNELVLYNHNSFYLIISMLIILGGIGFPVLINLKKQLTYYLLKIYHIVFRRGAQHNRYSHLVGLNTRIVLIITFILIVSGTVLIYFLEKNGAFAGMPAADKIVHSFFNAVVPRTAGFNSVAVSDFSRLTIILIIVLMWIGGSSQSTAGGIKVNTIAVAFASMKSLFRGQKTTELFNREITYNTIRRTLVVIVGSVVVILTFFVGILILEPQFSMSEVLFETVSAFSTVGLSLGITPSLCDGSKFLLVLLMFIGRVGFITVMMSFVPKKEKYKYRLPKEDIIIN